MKDTVVWAIIVLILGVSIWAIAFFTKLENAAFERKYRQQNMEILQRNGGLPTILPQNHPHASSDSVLIYETCSEITKEELRALNYFAENYDITLYVN